MKANYTERRYSVYEHVNKETGKTYIGITSKDPKLRWNYGVGYNHNSDFKSDIETYGWNEGFNHYILISDVSYEEATEYEKSLITFFTSINRSYNVYNGGIGDFKQSESSRLKRSLSNPRCRKVYQIDKTTGEIVGEYRCILEASRQTGIDQSHISKVCKGKANSCGGFKWEYIKD